jgi:hypothetical protein
MEPEEKIYRRAVKFQRVSFAPIERVTGRRLEGGVKAGRARSRRGELIRDLKVISTDVSGFTGGGDVSECYAVVSLLEEAGRYHD